MAIPLSVVILKGIAAMQEHETPLSQRLAPLKGFHPGRGPKIDCTHAWTFEQSYCIVPDQILSPNNSCHSVLFRANPSLLRRLPFALAEMPIILRYILGHTPAGGARFLYLLCLLAFSGLGACRDAGTADERAQRALGIVPGQVNELVIRGTRFRFPPELVPEVQSLEHPVKGVADVATIHIDLSSLLKRGPLPPSEEFALVRIEIRSQGYENDAKSAVTLARGPWRSVMYRPDYALREYIRPPDDGGWGYRTYESVDPARRTPTGGRIVFACAGLPGTDPTLCETYLQHPRGPIISYYLSGMLMPHWWQVHTEVLNVVNKLIVK